ncbi:hypothetical protein Trydic_g21044, partial [Trypoxylus dichotomus]
RKAADKTIPVKTVDPFKYSELPIDVRNLIRCRNRLRKLYQRTRRREDREEFQRLSTVIRRRVRQHRDEIYEERLRRINPRDGSIWRLNKHLRSQRTKIYSIDNPDGTAALQDRDIAANLAGAFEEYHNTPETDPATETQVEESLRSFYLHNPIFPETSLEFLTSPRCIRKLISKSPSLKAPGNDNIQNHILKHIPRKTLAQFTYIFNAALKLQYFPSAWKTATVVPVPKPGKEPRLATSYRPISLLPAISKIFEKILLRHVNKYTNQHSVLPPEQFGFR